GCTRLGGPRSGADPPDARTPFHADPRVRRGAPRRHRGPARDRTMTALSTSLILRLAGHPWFRHIATDTGPGRSVASRFVAGETLDQAMNVARDLDRTRVAAMLDHLGENVETATQAG